MEPENNVQSEDPELFQNGQQLEDPSSIEFLENEIETQEQTQETQDEENQQKFDDVKDNEPNSSSIELMDIEDNDDFEDDDVTLTNEPATTTSPIDQQQVDINNVSIKNFIKTNIHFT